MEGVPALEGLLEAGYRPEGVVTLTGAAAAKRSGAADYASVCERFAVPLHEVADINAESSIALLESMSPDVLFVIGWSQLLKPAALRTARLGVIGAHASLLPRNRGSAPVNWAIVRGERITGNTLIWLTEEVDNGDVIDQTPIAITPFDTCATIYSAVAEANKSMILRLMPRLCAGERPGRSQPRLSEPVLPRRRPADGIIDWSEGNASVYDFVRALTRPYPGAFSWLDGRKWTVWSASQLPAIRPPGVRPGEILGPAISPCPDACGQVVATGRGLVLLLHVQAEDGCELRGQELANQPWCGRRWANA